MGAVVHTQTNDTRMNQFKCQQSYTDPPQVPCQTRHIEQHVQRTGRDRLLQDSKLQHPSSHSEGGKPENACQHSHYVRVLQRVVLLR